MRRVALRKRWSVPAAGSGISRQAIYIVVVCSMLLVLSASAPASSHAQAEESARAIPAAEDPALAEAELAVRMKDFERAVEIWRAAAMRGVPEAAYRLGVAYRSGIAVEKDNREAAKWFGIAADGGDHAAQFALGTFYQNGIVVPRDRDEANRLFGLAARGGNREARKRLERLSKPSPAAFGDANARVAANRKDPREALNQAIRLGDTGSAKWALARGAPVDGAPGDTRHWRPLILAIESGRFEMVQLLLAQQANANLRSRIGEPALVLAVRSGDRRIVRALLAAGAIADVRAVNGCTPLMESARLGHRGISDDLISAGADPKIVLEDGTSAASLARRFGHDALSQSLRRRGAPVVDGVDPNQRRRVLAAGSSSGTNQGPSMPPVVEAARRGDVALLREIITHDIDLEATDSDGENALTRAAEGGHLEAVQLLIAGGLDPDQRGAQGATALMRAMASTAEGASAVMEALLEGGADLHARDASGRGVIDFASQGATKQKLELLVRHGGSWTSANLRSGLSEASAAGRVGPLTALLGIAKEPGELAGVLCRAVEQGRLEILSLLVSAGAHTTDDCGEKRTALTVASNSGNQEIVRRLVELGADPNQALAGGDTALIAAAGRGHTSIVRLLIESGAEVDRRGAQRMTALMAAATNGHADAAEALLEAGADRGMRSATKMTALGFAQQSGDARTAALIESYRPGWRNLLGLSRD